jgi:hypothetical protein
MLLRLGPAGGWAIKLTAGEAGFQRLLLAEGFTSALSGGALHTGNTFGKN